MDKQSKKPVFDGRRMRALRKQQNLSADGLAYKAGFTSHHISQMERGKRPRTAAITLASVAQVLGTTVEYLLCMTDEPTFYRAEHLDASTQV